MYTDWANCYLERVKSKRRVTNLDNDCRDGLLLADIVEGVTGVKVTDLIRKPKTQQQMVSLSSNQFIRILNILLINLNLNLNMKVYI